MTSTRPHLFLPTSPVGRLLAAVRQMIGERRFGDAIPLMLEAAALEPENALIQTDLGRLYLEAGRFEDALAPLRCAIALNPGGPIAYWHVGVALQHLRETGDAIEALERAVQLQPSLADAHYRLGLLHEEESRSQQALESYRIAARLAVDRPVRQFIQARVCVLEGREEEAEALLRRVIERQPDMPMAQLLLGEILAGFGRFDEAAACFEAELSNSPGVGMVYYNLVRCRKITSADEELFRRMDAVLELDGLNDYNRANLLLARGKAFDDIGQYERAMQSWDDASAARARFTGFDADSFESTVDSIIRVFSNVTMARFAACGSDDRTPVIILGMPRSGTTLCEQIISSHPDVGGAGELGFWDARLNFALQAGIEDGFVRECGSGYAALLRKVRERGRFAATASRICDKNPFNFFNIGLINLAFPRAAIIHCRRSPVDTALSIHQTHFATWTALPTGGEELVRYYRAYQRLMAHWREVLPAGRIFEVDYESLTTSPEEGIRRIVDYVGLDWSDSCLRPEDNVRIVRTPSRWQVRQGINTKSVDRWRRYQPWLGSLAALAPDSE